MDTMINAELNINIAAFFLNEQSLKMIQQKTNVYVAVRTVKENLMKS